MAYADYNDLMSITEELLSGEFVWVANVCIGRKYNLPLCACKI